MERKMIGRNKIKTMELEELERGYETTNGILQREYIEREEY